jgi:hypothetical protein
MLSACFQRMQPFPMTRKGFSEWFQDLPCIPETLEESTFVTVFSYRKPDSHITL